MNRYDHCSHPDQAWCDCDWCRLVRADQKRDNWSDPPFSALDRNGNIRAEKAEYRRMCCGMPARDGVECCDGNGKAIAAKRAKRNAAARARYQVRRDFGLVRTPYGWE